MNPPVKRLLIVDDDRDDRDLFIAAVKEVDSEIECLSANNGQEALTVLKDMDPLPGIIVLDLRMPRYGGKKCLVEIKKDERLKDIPVFIYTTSRSPEESNELAEIGACHFITKPNAPDEIYWLASYILGEQWVIPGRP